ncbi:hypothetical protein FOCC_FOCC012359, partial [Frankliniella occidentalis]
ESLRNEPRGPRIAAGDSNFVVAHYTGKVTYDVRAMAAKNRDFLPPEMIETMRLSNDANIKLMFTNQLSKSGNLTAPSPPGGVSRPTKEGPKKTRWGAALIAETGKCRFGSIAILHAYVYTNIHKYQFLAFDFDESVEITKDNCRLLLIRLKMEGWVLGKTKVFLKYYHEEYLSRLYEQQVKKIVKVQCMMRAFLAKRNMQTKLKRLKSQDSGNRESFDLG